MAGIAYLLFALTIIVFCDAVKILKKPKKGERNANETSPKSR